MSRTVATADAVVIGGGIVGTSTAYHLTRMGAKVVLLERGAIASGTSGACDGQILIADRHPGPELELGKLAVRRWKELAAELPFDVEYEVNGSTLIAEVEEDLGMYWPSSSSHFRTSRWPPN